jgi:endonuclease YncB( thermonuclease family)
MMKRTTSWSALSLCLGAGLSTLLAGCGLFEKPPVEPIPTPVPTPKPDIFDPKAYNTNGVALNAAGDPKLPEYFQLVRIYSGNLIWVRSVDVVTPPAPKGGKSAPAPAPGATPAPERLTYGAPEIMRLSGIAVPLPGQPGAQESIRTLSNWTLGRKLTIEQDPKYPVDFDEPDLNRVGAKSARRVQIFFEGGGGDAKTSLNLNRMMIRSGYAVVDEHEPTIFDTKGWLNDEEYARRNRLGLWKLGIILNQRVPPPAPAKPAGKTASGKPGTVPVPAATSTTTTATAPGAPPPAPPAP